MSARSRSGDRYPPASDPSPPASLTAATNAGVLGPPPIGAATIGSWIPSRRTASVSHSRHARLPGQSLTRSAPSAMDTAKTTGGPNPAVANAFGHRPAHPLDGVERRQRQGGTAEAAAGHAGGHGTGRHRGTHRHVEFGAGDLVVVPQGTVGAGQGGADRLGLAPAEQVDHLEDPVVLGDDVARPAERDLVEVAAIEGRVQIARSWRRAGPARRGRRPPVRRPGAVRRRATPRGRASPGCR